MKKLINVAMASVLGLSVVGVSQASLPSNQGSGTVTFKGQIIDAPCAIEPESTNKVVEFGDLNAHVLNDGKKIVPFSIKLENCDLADLKTKSGGKTPKNIVNIAFTGPMVNGKTYMLNAAGETGVGVMISTLNNDTYIKMDGTPTPAAAFMNGKGEILLEAIATAADNSHGVLPGEFNVTANFSLSYE